MQWTRSIVSIFSAAQANIMDFHFSVQPTADMFSKLLDTAQHAVSVAAKARLAILTTDFFYFFSKAETHAFWACIIFHPRCCSEAAQFCYATPDMTEKETESEHTTSKVAWLGFSFHARLMIGKHRSGTIKHLLNLWSQLYSFLWSSSHFKYIIDTVNSIA